MLRHDSPSDDVQHRDERIISCDGCFHRRGPGEPDTGPRRLRARLPISVTGVKGPRLPRSAAVSGPGGHRLPTQREAEEKYKAAVGEWLWENPSSADAAMALVRFAGIVAANRLVGEVTRYPVNDERDAFHQSVFLASAAGWLNDRAIKECIQRERAEQDAELLTLVAEYTRRYEYANERGEISDDERARRCDAFRSTRAKIEKIRPATLRGVLAVLELETDEDDDWWPAEAVACIREILKIEEA